MADTATTAGGSKPLEFLVLDAGALIRGHGLSLYQKAKRVVTVPDVLMEIRDSKSRELLERLPFEIEERMPSQSSINTVAAFAKKTGDFAAISKTDLRLIALTHMLELELNGKKYLNDVAGKVTMSSLSAQLEQAKKKPEQDAPVSSEAPAVPVKATLPKPNIWATKSWATVLTGGDSPSATESTTQEPSGDDQAVAGGAEEGSEDSESGLESGGEEEEDAEVEVEGEGEEEQQREDVDHFVGETAVQDVVEALAESRLDDTVPAEAAAVAASTEGDEEEEEHIVAGFQDGPCGCGDAGTSTTATAVEGSQNQQHHHHEGPPATTTTAATAPAAVKKDSEPYHTRMMRPTGLASGNNAESQRLRLEDDGLGWVNSTNILHQKGRNGADFGTARATTKRSTTKQRNVNVDDGSSTVASTTAPTEGTAASASTAAAATTTTADAPKRKKKPKKRPTKVACLTTDFSMQNVMLQMDLRVMSVDGLMIKTARQWVLRCMGCFEVHYDMDRLFCRKCGGHHLSRVSASVDAGGVLKLHLKKNYHVDLQGSKYSLPAPGKQGRYQGELLLREDQLLQGIWKQKCVKIRKDIKSAFGEDVTSDVGMHINKGQAIKIGLGKRNPNAAKGRERRGKAKANTAK